MTGERRSGRGALTAVSVSVLTGVLAAGCAQQPAASIASAGHQQQAEVSTARLAAAVGPSQPAGTQLRLETLLSHHAVLTINLMRARLRGDPDLAQAAVAAVSKNTDDMTAVIDSIAGHELAAS
jgi:hypothetical protein